MPIELNCNERERAHGLTSRDDGVGDRDLAAGSGAGLLRVSYAGPDRAWVEWLCQQLAGAGLMAEPALLDPGPDEDLAEALRRDLDAADVVLMVVTDAYFRVGSCSHQEWTAAFAALDVDFERILLVAVSPCAVPPLPRPRTLVNLSKLGEGDARRELLRWVAGANPAAPPVLVAGPVRPLVRFPADQPPVWSGQIPPRNPHFTGRDATLLQLRDRLSDDVTAIVPNALHGMGGVGKTQLAIEYAYRFAADYDVVWWVRAEQPAQARFDLADLATDLKVRVSADISETVRAVLNGLRRGQPYRNWLIIFDNARSPEELGQLLPGGRGHVLVTSRDPAWQASADQIELDVYHRSESVQFLQHRASGIAEADAVRLADELGDLPLALEAAAAWLAVTGMPASQYLTLAHRQLTEAFNQARVLTYEGPVVMAWTVSMNHLREDNPAAAQLLRLCAFLGPEPLPVTLFTGPVGAKMPPVPLPAPLHQEICEPLARGRIFREIGRYAVAKIGYRSMPNGHDTETVRVHRVVQKVLRELMPPGEHETFKRTAQLLVAAADPGDPEQPTHWPQYAELFLHVAPADLTSASGDARVRRFVLNEVRYLYMRGELSASQDLAQAAKRSWSAVLDQQDLDLVALNNHLANALRARGEYREARTLDEQNLRFAQEHLGPDHLEALQAANGLAATLRRLGEWRTAFDLDRDTLERSRRVYGSEHPRSMLAANNYAVSLRMLGRFAEALEVDEENMRRRERVYGESHQYTMLSINNVARDLRECGQYRQSCAMQERTYERYRELYGADHPDTMRAMKNLAVSRRKAGRYAEAAALARECLELHEARFGYDYPETVAAATNFANDLRLTGDSVAARARAEDAWQRSRRTAGDTNPYTLAAATNAALAFRRIGDPAAAREIDERTCEGFGEMLATNHPYALACLTNFASDLSATGELERARKIGERALEQLRRIREWNHPYTLACAVNLAADLRALGDRLSARSLEQDTLERYESTLGDAHPEAIAAAERARIDCDIEPPPT